MLKKCNFKNIQTTLLNLLNNRKFKDKPQYIYLFSHLLARVNEDNKIRFVLLEWVKESSFLTERILRKAVSHLEQEMIISTIKEGNKKFIRINDLDFNERHDTMDNMNENAKKVMKKTMQHTDLKGLSIESDSKKVMNNQSVLEKKVMSEWDTLKDVFASRQRPKKVQQIRFMIEEKVERYNLNGEIVIENEEKDDKNEQARDIHENVC